MTTEKWTRHKGGWLCERHGETFGRLEQCAACKTDPVAPPETEAKIPIPEAPEGCRTSVQHEVWLTALAEYSLEQAKKLCTGKGRVNYSTAAKLIECAIKSMRAAAIDFALPRERRAYLKELRKDVRELRAGRGRRGARWSSPRSP